MSYHYTKDKLAAALRNVGLKAGNLVFSHSNIGYLGYAKGERNIENAFHTILDAFFDVIGSKGTLVVPTFTYSFPKNKVYDPDNTPSDCGIFTELLRQKGNAIRSNDPCVSVAAIGRQADEMVFDTPENAYGENSFFDRFYKAKGVICNINFDAGSTFVHYVERCLQVPYRFDKTFAGVICKNNQQKKTTSTIWVRHLVEGTAAKFETFDKLARDVNKYKVCPVGRGFVGLITAQDTYNLIANTLSSRPWFLTEAETLGIDLSQHWN